jgi:outer membrane protein OmpA-like peptidoglycan-associated protein
MTFARRRNPLSAPQVAGESTSATRRPRSAVTPDLTSTGKPLEPETRGFFESRFGHDFSRVRVHADATASVSARSAAARAYTHGSDIVFGSGMYRPNSPSGTRLLAHELAHVVQQDRSTSASGGDYEAEARAASDRIAMGERPSVTLAAPAGVQRDELPGAPSADLTEGAGPFLAAAMGSVTLDGFETGKSGLSADNEAKLARTAETMEKLFRQYPASSVRIIGYTDAVGKESDNQSLGQARADAVQTALLDRGITGSAVQTESRGATELVVRSTKGEPRNRRVEVRFQPSRLLRGAFTEGLTLTPPGVPPPGPAPGGTAGGVQGGVPGVGDLCKRLPDLCYGKGGPQPVPPGALQPVPDDTPFELMDVQGVNEQYSSHGTSPREGGDLRATWAEMVRKYRRLGFSKSKAAWLANKELSSAAGQTQSRDNPNSADRADKDLRNAYPDATKIGPGSIKLFEF